MLHFKILPQTSKNLHRLICHICDISQLCNSAPSVKMSRESDPDEDRDLNYLDGYWDGYDKAAQQFVDDYYRNGDYTSDESESDEESSDYTSDESGSDKDKDSDSDKDEDHKYTYKYKYKYAYKPSDNPAKPSPNPDKPSDNPAKPSPNPAKPKNKPKDDKQTDQKYSVNCISTRYYNTDSDSEDERPIASEAQMRIANEKFNRANEKF